MRRLGTAVFVLLASTISSCSASRIAAEGATYQGSGDTEGSIEMSAEELSEFFGGIELRRTENSKSSTPLELFERDGRWTAYVESSVRVKFEGHWNVQLDAQSEPLICTTYISVADPNSEEHSACRRIEMTADHSVIRLTEIMISHLNIRDPRFQPTERIVTKIKLESRE